MNTPESKKIGQRWIEISGFFSTTRIWIAGLGVAVAAAVTGCSDSTDAGTGAVLSGEFLALSYNVAGLPEALSGSNPEANMPLIAPLLNGYDLVLTQEDWQTPEPNALAPLRVYHEILAAGALHPYRSEPAPLPLGSDPSRPTAQMSDGLNRFSQFPFDMILRQAWASCDNSSGDCLAFKGFSVARTALASGVCVDVFNLHGEAGNTEGDQALKADNTRDLVNFINEFSVGRAIILGGDFNMRLRRSEDAQNLSFLESATGVTDACAALGIVDEEAIDKFFFRSSESVTVSPASCHFELETFVTATGEPLSDHDALAVGFTWSGTPVDAGSCL